MVELEEENLQLIQVINNNFNDSDMEERKAPPLLELVAATMWMLQNLQVYGENWKKKICFPATQNNIYGSSYVFTVAKKISQRTLWTDVDFCKNLS